MTVQHKFTSDIKCQTICLSSSVKTAIVNEDTILSFKYYKLGKYKVAMKKKQQTTKNYKMLKIKQYMLKFSKVVWQRTPVDKRKVKIRVTI